VGGGWGGGGWGGGGVMWYLNFLTAGPIGLRMVSKFLESSPLSESLYYVVLWTTQGTREEGGVMWCFNFLTAGPIRLKMVSYFLEFCPLSESLYYVVFWP